MPIAILAGTLGVCMFYVQHQFEDVYWESSENWSYADAALQGSSYLKLPKLLQFFTGNIGLHHVHHLSAKIPNYNLQRAHDEIPIFQDVPVLTIRDGLRSIRLKLIDPASGRLLTWREVKVPGLSRGGDGSVPEMLLHAGQVLRPCAPRRPSLARRPPLRVTRSRASGWTLADGARTTLRVARFDRSRLRRPRGRDRAAARPCSAGAPRNRAEHAMIGGFYMRPGGPPLGDLRIGGRAHPTGPSTRPGERFAPASTPRTGRSALAPRRELPDRARGGPAPGRARCWSPPAAR